MQIGELFINLGVKGTEQTQKALSSIKFGLGETKSMSLEAKAAIVAAMYAVEQMGSGAAKTGNNLVQFSNNTGMSLVTLQKLEGAAIGAGASIGEMQPALEKIQSAFTNMNFGEGMDKGAAMIAATVGAISPEDLKNPLALMQKFQEFTQKVDPTWSKKFLEPLVGPGILSAMHDNAFTTKNVEKQRAFSGGQAHNLQKTYEGFTQLHRDIDFKMGDFLAKHGPQMITDIRALSTEVFKFADALESLADKLQVFKAIGEVFDGLTKAMRLLNGESVDQIQKDDKSKHHFGDGTWWMNLINKGEDTVLKAHDVDASRFVANQATKKGGTTTHILTVNQNLEHHGDHKDTHAVGQAHKKAAHAAHKEKQAAARIINPGNQ